MSSTDSYKREHTFVFVSHLPSLLKERGKTQKHLAEETGLRPARISRLVHQQIVYKIIAETSVKLCFALSRWPRVKDRKKITIGLDALFSMKRERHFERTR